jgi:hypothetical protein
LFVVGLLFCFTSCLPFWFWDDEDKKENVSFQSFSPYSVLVRNNTHMDLVAFNGFLTPDALISGIPAYSTAHGLKRTNAFYENESRLVELIFITKADYNANGNKLSNSTVFARIFVFYNHLNVNNNVYEINENAGGQGKLNVVNQTKYDVELREGSPDGRALGSTRGLAMNVISLSPGDYEVYPVFKFFHRGFHELFTLIPVFVGGVHDNRPWSVPFSFDYGNLDHRLNIHDINTFGKYSLGGVSISINNISGVPISIWNGNSPLRTSTEGVSHTPAGKTNIFIIPFTRNVDGTYPQTLSISSLMVIAGDNMFQVPSMEYELDYIYTITVSGTSISDFIVEPPVKEYKPDIEYWVGF